MFERTILDLIYRCNSTGLRVDFQLESRAQEFGMRDGVEFRAALKAMEGRLARLSFDNGYAVCIATPRSAPQLKGAGASLILESSWARSLRLQLALSLVLTSKLSRTIR